MSKELDPLDIFRQSKEVVPDIKFTIPSTGEDIFMRPFTTKEQKGILKAIEKEDQVLINEAFDQLIINCVLTKGFNIDELLTKDRDAILIELRKESVKNDFSFQWKCSECDNVNKETMDLDKLKFKKLKSKSSLEKVIELTGRNGLKLSLKLPTRKFEKMLYSEVSKNGKDEISAIDILNTTLAVSISKLIVPPSDSEVAEHEIEIDFKQRLSLLDEMDIDDKTKIESFLQGIDSYGYDMKIGKKKCKNCNHPTDIQLDWSDFFLT
jgi:hypothetical protein